MSAIYWRSPEQLEGSPESRQFLEREFPEGASELPEGITRRELMLLVGASLSLAGLTTACRRPLDEIVPYVQAPEQIIPGVPRYYATTMPFGRSAYGLVVESHEGRPTKIEGNPRHPSTAGTSSVRTQASILGLYDPDRSRSPLQRGEPRTWADFVAAWGEIEKAHLADGGAGLAVLSQSFASPTLARLAAQFRGRFSRARWAVHEAVSDENALDGIRAATGRALQPVLQLEKAQVILSLDADLLQTDPESIRHARGFAAGRRGGTAGETGHAMNRLYAVEAAYSLTGAMADHRLRLPARSIAPFLAALLARLSALGLQAGRLPLSGGPALPGSSARWIEAVAQDLLASRGRSLVVAGQRQAPAVHAAVLALNAALGNIGETIAYHEPVDAALPSLASVSELVRAMRAGAVKTLVVLGANPVYDAPADLEFAKAMASVPMTIALGHGVDETSRAAVWHLPRAHYLEAWGDARAIGGTLSVVQPLILPLFGAKSDAEILGLLVSGQDRPGYDLVRETWQPVLGAADFEKRWNRVLHDGLLAGSELPPVSPDLGASPGTPAAAAAPDADEAGTLEIVFVPSPALHDGRFANDSWLQELPDSLTKLTWDNPALVSPATARTLGVTSEDLVRVDFGGRSLEIAVSILPGLADGVLALTLGYGRVSSGRVGTGVGFDTYRLRGSASLGGGGGARVTSLGRAYGLSTTQEHGSMEGRPIIREEIHGDSGHGAEHGGDHGGEHAPELFSLWKEPSYEAGHQWGMTIDLNTCIGCNACMVACQSENNVPVVGKQQVRKGREMLWLRVDRYFAGDPEGAGDEGPRAVFQPVPCMQCENAPCEQVCPVGATVHDAEGMNVMVYNRCIGTRYCSNNCPYKVRRFNFFNFTKDTPEILKLVQNPDVTVRARGVMEKCTYCTQRINAAKISARLEGRTLADGDVQTACQQACPASAIEFGDIRNAASRVAKAKTDPRNYALLEELNTKPRTTYLAKVRNPNPALAGAADA